MDSLSATTITILGNYALDAGVTLAKEAGLVARETAEKLFAKVLHHLRQKPESKAIAGGYQRNYKAPLQDQLEAAVQADPSFKQELYQLLTQFEAQKQAFQLQVGAGGAAAVGERATAVGQRGVNIGGSVQGPIITGSGNTVYTGANPGSVVTIPPDLAPLRDNLARYFNRSELESLCFDMGLAHDDLPGETRSQLAQSLVAYCYQHNRLPELRRRCQQARPHGEWS
jgi:hypothetical protein